MEEYNEAAAVCNYDQALAGCRNVLKTMSPADRANFLIAMTGGGDDPAEMLKRCLAIIGYVVAMDLFRSEE